MLLPLLALLALAAPPPQLVAVRQPMPAAAETMKSTRLPASTLTWGEIHTRAWAGTLTRADITALQAVTQLPESVLALRYLLTNAEARGDAQGARRTVDAMLTIEFFRTNPELLAIDARLRANAGDLAGASASAAKARARLDTLEDTVRKVALAHILSVEAVLAQAALDAAPDSPDLRARAVAAWSAVASHAATTGPANLEAIARASLDAVRTR
jgi:hypothetical protein